MFVVGLFILITLIFKCARCLSFFLIYAVIVLFWFRSTMSVPLAWFTFQFPVLIVLPVVLNAVNVYAKFSFVLYSLCASMFTSLVGVSLDCAVGTTVVSLSGFLAMS